MNNCSNNGLCISPQKCDCFGNWIGADCGGFDIGETGTNPLGNDQEKNTNKGGSNRNVAVIAGVVPVVIVLIVVAVVVAIFLVRR